MTKPLNVLLFFTFFLKIITSNEIDCSEQCVLSQLYWKTHSTIEKEKSQKIPWPFICGSILPNSLSVTSLGTPPEFNRIFNGTSDWISVITEKNNNFCINVASEFIATFLNICKGACLEDDNILVSYLYKIPTLLDEYCRIGGLITTDETNKLTRRKQTKISNNDMVYLRDASRYMLNFNSGGMKNPVCMRKQDLDLNNNGVSDICEIENIRDDFSILDEPIDKLCDDNFVVIDPQVLQCKLRPTQTRNFTVTNEQLCRIIKSNKKPLDCNHNGIIDSLEVKSNSELKCNSNSCFAAPSIERTPLECFDCKSDDENLDGIPDSCQITISSYIIENSKMIFSDCNGDKIDDKSSIITGIVQDENGNLIPDECEWGACCDEEGRCRNTNMIECFDEIKSTPDFPDLVSWRNTTFSPGKLCKDEKQCHIIEKQDQVGSCCHRMGNLNNFIKCSDNISKRKCDDYSGTFNERPCSEKDCRTSIGSCCLGYGKKCINNVSWKWCSDFEDSVFDGKLCSEEDCICNTKNETNGSCFYSGICEDDVSFFKCYQLFGNFDIIKCENRLDKKEIQYGSCCVNKVKYKGKNLINNFSKNVTTNIEPGENDYPVCIDNIREDECSSSSGRFYNDETCKTNNFCHPKNAKQCCYNMVTKECSLKREEDSCLSTFGKNWTWIDCDDKTTCKKLTETWDTGLRMDGCCRFEQGCIIFSSLNLLNCEFLGGNVLNPDECIQDKYCIENITDLKTYYNSLSLKEKMMNYQKQYEIENEQNFPIQEEEITVRIGDGNLSQITTSTTMIALIGIAFLMYLFYAGIALISD